MSSIRALLYICCCLPCTYATIVVWGEILSTDRYFFFFFQAEDGIRDWSVTGVQTCALPISENIGKRKSRSDAHFHLAVRRCDQHQAVSEQVQPRGRLDEAALLEIVHPVEVEIGRASCRERV